MPSSTHVAVRVIANGGTFLGDNVGGAAVLVRDADTMEILDQGVTSGDSGPDGSVGPLGQPGVMGVALRRGQSLPKGTRENPDTSAKFIAKVPCKVPRKIEINAYGPLGACDSANIASVTTWILPGAHILDGNAILLEIRGLICRILQPPSSTSVLRLVGRPTYVNVIAYVAMICGSPISEKAADAVCPGRGHEQPWLPSQYQVYANTSEDPKIAFMLEWDGSRRDAGRFIGRVPFYKTGSFKVTVHAHDLLGDNIGIDSSTVHVSVSEPVPSTLPDGNEWMSRIREETG